MSDAQFKAQTHHWETLELLDRYAQQMQRAGRNAAAMYPGVAEHLADCASCRAVLDALLDSDDPSQKDATPIPPGRLNFLQHDASPEGVRVSLWSNENGFRVRISFVSPSNAAGISSDGITMRGINAISSDGRLLLAQEFELRGHSINLILTLYNGDQPDRYEIVGELFADHLPSDIEARLHVGSETYFASLQGRELRFTGVDYPAQPTHLQITLEST